jgi:hypothetical protein
MLEESYIVRLKQAEIGVRPVVAVRAEIQGANLVFLNSDGRLTASFFLDMAHSRNEMPNQGQRGAFAGRTELRPKKSSIGESPRESSAGRGKCVPAFLSVRVILGGTSVRPALAPPSPLIP